jgi:hypothetical protein
MAFVIEVDAFVPAPPGLPSFHRAQVDTDLLDESNVIIVGCSNTPTKRLTWVLVDGVERQVHLVEVSDGLPLDVR